MKHFLKPNPNTANPEIRKPAIRERLAVGLVGSAAVAACTVMYKSAEGPGPRFVSIIFGIAGGLTATLPVFAELAERYDNDPRNGNEGEGGNGGGGGWEPPAGPEPRGPGGIPEPHPGELIQEIEEYLASKQPASV